MKTNRAAAKLRQIHTHLRDGGGAAGGEGAPVTSAKADSKLYEFCPVGASGLDRLNNIDLLCYIYKTAKASINLNLIESCMDRHLHRSGRRAGI